MLLNQAMRAVEGRYIESGATGTPNQRAVLINLMAQIETIGQHAVTEEAAVTEFIQALDDMLAMWGTIPRFRSEWRIVNDIREEIAGMIPAATPAG